jgi:hypothetical protein
MLCLRMIFPKKGFYDDDVDVAFSPRKGTGKARVRVESDDEPEDGSKEGCIEATPSRSSTAPPSTESKDYQAGRKCR